MAKQVDRMVNPVRKLVNLVTLLLCFLPLVNVEAKTCVVSDFGALGGGLVVETQSLQAALDACTAKGDVVLFEGNTTYLTGGLSVHGATQVQLPAGARLLGSKQRNDYGATMDDWYLLRLHCCRGCSIVGEGIIDGQARAFVYGKIPGDRKLVKNWPDPSCANPKQCRPRLVGVTHSTQVTIQGVSLVDCIYWCLHVFNSSQVEIAGVNITADFDIPNNDGIDVDGSSHVVIKDCNIYTADDGVCIKTTRPGLIASYVHVRRCNITSKSAAVKIGSESHGNIRALRFKDLQITGSHRGLGVQMRDLGNLSDVIFTDISIQTQLYNRTWWGGGEPIYVTAGPRRWSQPVAPSVTGVRFHNISVNAEAGMVIVGHPSAALEVVISHVTLRMAHSTDWPGGYRDLRPGFLEVKDGVAIPAVYAANATHLSLSTIRVVMDHKARPEWGGLLHAATGTVRELAVGSLQFEDGRAASPVTVAHHDSMGDSWLAEPAEPGSLGEREPAAMQYT